MLIISVNIIEINTTCSRANFNYDNGAGGCTRCHRNYGFYVNDAQDGCDTCSNTSSISYPNNAGTGCETCDRSSF